jgi:hypothetical protein
MYAIASYANPRLHAKADCENLVIAKDSHLDIQLIKELALPFRRNFCGNGVRTINKPSKPEIRSKTALLYCQFGKYSCFLVMRIPFGTGTLMKGASNGVTLA